MNDKLVGIVFVLLAVVIESFGQMFLKMSADRGSGPAGDRRFTAAGVSCLAIEAVVYTLALKMLDVSVAFPMGSLTFVAVLVLSRLFLNEKVNSKRWVGVGLILSGTVLVGLN